VVLTRDEFSDRLWRLVARGQCSRGEAEEATAFFDALAERELRGELTHEQAIAEVVDFGVRQVRRRRVS
jgi:hypothetical protein